CHFYTPLFSLGQLLVITVSLYAIRNVIIKRMLPNITPIMKLTIHISTNIHIIPQKIVNKIKYFLILFILYMETNTVDIVTILKIAQNNDMVMVDIPNADMNCMASGFFGGAK